MTRHEADAMANRINGMVKQGPRWKAIFDKHRHTWCIEGPSVNGGTYRTDDTGMKWYDGQ